MKKALSFSLWNEPDVRIELFNSTRPLPVRVAVWTIANAFHFFRLHLVKPAQFSQDQRAEGRPWPVYADTMIGLRRLDNLQFCIESVIKNGIEGDLIETGVWRGGACIFMKAILAAYGIQDRRVFVADSFAGLPKPDAAKYPQDRGDKFHTATYLAVSLEDVKANFAKYELLDDKVVFLQGWFAITLPNAPIEKLAVMRLDGDMYGSTMDALVNLYPKLSTGGYCIIDDYALPPCRQAVDDFRTKWNIKEPLVRVDWTGVYWEKTSL